MKTLLAVFLMLLPFVAFGQQSSEDDRLREIRGAMNTRMVAQGDQWFEDGEFLKIIDSYKVRAEMFPHYEEAWTDLIYLLFSTQNAEEELHFAIRYRELNADDADAYFPEANIYSRLGLKAYAKVIPLLEKSIAMTPRPHGNSYRILGSCYKRLGMLEAAVRVYRAMLEAYPDDAAAKANLARAEADLKKKQGG